MYLKSFLMTLIVEELEKHLKYCNLVENNGSQTPKTRYERTYKQCSL